MARKRKGLGHLDYESQEYWNRLLSREGLSLDRGKSSKLLYIGGASEVERLSGFLQTDTGIRSRRGLVAVDRSPDDKE